MDVWVPTVCGLGAAAFLVGVAYEWRTGLRSHLLTGLLCGLCATSVMGQNADLVHRIERGEYAHSWNIYHYYLGSKYFAEVGFHDLYLATLSVAREERLRGNDRLWAPRTRNMHTYRKVDSREALRDYTDPFTPARKEAFRADLKLLRSKSTRDKWHRMLHDLGFNPGPPWILAGQAMAWIADPTSPFIRQSDINTWAVVVVALLWGFGPRATALALLFATNVQFNLYRQLGGLLEYDWLASVVLAICLYKRGWGGLAGLSLSWGAMTRIFPGIVVLPAFLAVGRQLRAGELDRNSRPLRFVVALSLGCLLLGVAAHGTGLGARTYPDWFAKIGRHSEYHAVTGDRRVGVGRLALHKVREHNPFGIEYGAPADVLERTAVRKRLLQASIVLLVALAVIRRDEEDGMLLMIPLAFALTVSSRYYATWWMLLPLLGLAGGGRERVAGVLGTVGVLGVAAISHNDYGRPGQYIVINYAAYVTFLVVLLSLVASDIQQLRRRE